MLTNVFRKPHQTVLQATNTVALRILKHVFLGLLAATVVFPMIWLFYTSLKTGQELFANAFALPEVPQWSNYVRAWTRANVGRYFLNSVFVTSISLSCGLIVCTMAAYILSRYVFRGRQIIFFTFIAAMMVPGFLGLVPLWFLLRSVGLLGGYAGLIPVYIAHTLPFGIFFLSAFFKTISYELEEAAIIDGCTNFGVFFRIVFPMMASGLISIGIFSFLGILNEYTNALVLLSKDNLRTLPLGMAYLLITSRYRTDWGAMFAGLTIAVIPTLGIYMAFQSRLTKGISIGALKG